MDAPTYQHAYHDPAVAGIVRDMTQGLTRLRDALLASTDGNIDLASLRVIPEDQYKPLYAVARRLCDEGEFRHALPIAMNLAMHSDDSRFAFMAGSCLQRLGQAEFAASMFSACLLNNGDHVAAMFRLGECFAAIGDAEHAIESFEATVHMGRSNARNRSLQEKADAKLAKLRPFVGKQPSKKFAHR